MNQQTQSFLTGLLGVNTQNFNFQSVVNATGMLSNNQLDALVRALQANPQGMRLANQLTQQLRQQGRIGRDQQVIGFSNGRVLVATNGQVSAAIAVTGNAKGNVQLTPQAQNILNGLNTVNSQNPNITGVIDISRTLDPTQINALMQALKSNPQDVQFAIQLTQLLRRQGRIGPNQQVVGYLNGQVFVSGNGQLNSALGGGPRSGTTYVRLNPQAQNILNGLNGLNPQNFNFQTAANLSGALDNIQMTALIAALNNNPQFMEVANALTQLLRQQGRIGQDQQVVGFANGQVFVATNAQVAAALATGQDLNARVATLINGLASANLPTLNNAVIVNVNSVLGPAQVTQLIQNLESNQQARQVADTLTQQMRAAGRLRPTQRVIGFENGQVIVTTVSQ